MVGIAQLVRAPDCGSGCRGFESHYPPHMNKARAGALAPALTLCPGLPTQGCSQVARQGTLTPSLVGSNPTIPATFFPEYDSVAQSVEQLPFKPWVRGSSPRWVTTSSRTSYRSRRLFLCKSPRSFVPSLLLSKSTPLCWASIWFVAAHLKVLRYRNEKAPPYGGAFLFLY